MFTFCPPKTRQGFPDNGILRFLFGVPFGEGGRLPLGCTLSLVELLDQPRSVGFQLGDAAAPVETSLAETFLHGGGS